MAFNFNDRGIGVVDYPTGSKTYISRKPTESAGTVEASAINRTDDVLKTLVEDDFDLNKNGGQSRKDLINTLSGSFFLISSNAKLLAIALFHLYTNGFFVVSGDDLNIDERFSFTPEMFDLDNTDNNLSKYLALLKETIKYTKNAKKASENVNYNRYLLKSVATIYRYERYIVEYLTKEE